MERLPSLHEPEDWDIICLKMAKLIAMRSKDPHTQVGCLLVSPDKRSVHWGFNGFPINFPENIIRWQRPEKYNYVLHAESNAIVNAKTDLFGWTAYLTMFPCSKCALLLVQSKIKRVVYIKEYAGQTGDIDLSRQILGEGGIEYEQKLF